MNLTALLRFSELLIPADAATFSCVNRQLLPLQELLAAQLIRALADIFQESSLPLYLRPYEVLVTSNRTALIELVPDSLSVHTIKAKSAPGASLSDHFFAKFGRGTAACLAAQRAFAESMAGYSIACYLLQIKVRPHLSACLPFYLALAVYEMLACLACMHVQPLRACQLARRRTLRRLAVEVPAYWEAYIILMHALIRGTPHLTRSVTA